MLHVIQSLNDPLCRLVADDPVRPEIPIEFRVGIFSEIFVLKADQGDTAAVVCCAYRSYAPATISELAQMPQDVPHVAVFYTIWSYKSGAGRRLITEAKDWIEQNRKEINEFVTLSPPTEMARTFHLRNGAQVLRINNDSVNYIYS